MRYGPDHKEQSREKILEAARDLFRSRGFEGTSIDQVMKGAGLTRGAFYAHFGSKDELVREVLRIEAGLVESLRLAVAADEPKAAAMAAFGNYLDPAQRHNVASGCPLVAHPVDAIRSGGGRKDGYTERLQALIASIDAVVEGDDAADRTILAAVLAIGGGLLSAASADPALAERIDEACLGGIERLLDSAFGSERVVAESPGLAATAAASELP